MTLLKQKFTRKRFDVEAVLVTEENIHQVAEWCNGHAFIDSAGKKLIEVPVKRVAYPKQREAHVGMWVVYSETTGGFKVYKDAALRTNFEAILNIPEVPTFEVVQEQLFELNDNQQFWIKDSLDQGVPAAKVVNAFSLSMQPSVQKYIDSINKEN